MDAGRRCCLTFCADNGVVDEGVTQTDRSVTARWPRSIAGWHRQHLPHGEIARCDVFAVDVGMETRWTRRA